MRRYEMTCHPDVQTLLDGRGLVMHQEPTQGQPPDFPFLSQVLVGDTLYVAQGHTVEEAMHELTGMLSASFLPLATHTSN